MERYIRMATILENKSNIKKTTTPAYTAYLNSDNKIAVKSIKEGADWNLKDSIKDKFISEYQESGALTEEKHIYGFCVDMYESNPEHAMTYTDDAVGLTPITFTGTNVAPNLGSWENIIKNFFGCKPVALYEDGTVYHYLDYNNFSRSIDGENISINSGTNMDNKRNFYNIMIEFRALYYRIYILDGKLYFKVANYKVNDDYVSDAFMYNNKMMQYLYINSFRIKMAGIGKYYSTLSGESTNIDNSSLYNFKYYRDLILDGKKNSSLMGYAQYIYIVMIQCLIQKSLSMYDTFNPTSIAFESEYNPDGNGFGSSATDGLFRFKYIDKITNQPGFETNSGYHIKQIGRCFGLDDIVGGRILLDGIYSDNTGRLYYDRYAPFINTIDSVQTFKLNIDSQYFNTKCKLLSTILNCIVLPEFDNDVDNSSRLEDNERYTEFTFTFAGKDNVNKSYPFITQCYMDNTNNGVKNLSIFNLLGTTRLCRPKFIQFR